jgi:hypothetical protein
LESQTNLQKTRQREREKKEMRNEDIFWMDLLVVLLLFDGFVGQFVCCVKVCIQSHPTKHGKTFCRLICG